mgnify:CR=1 FL=1
MNREAVVSFRFPAFHSPNADQANKMILPQSALETIVDKKVAFPLTFEVRLDIAAPLGHTLSEGFAPGIPVCSLALC